MGEQVDGSITELESRDVTFLENDFPHGGEINLVLHLFVMDDIDASNNQNQLIQPIEEE